MEILDDRSVIYQLEVYKKWYEEQQQEIERLNNVIDELEKSLVNEINNKYSSNEYKQTMNLVLLKLKELKGSDEE